MKYNFICDRENELFNLALKENSKVIRYDNINQINIKKLHDCYLFILNDNYPIKNSLNESELNLLKNNNVNVVIEYPKSIYGVKSNSFELLDRERIVKNDDLSIGQNNCDYVLYYDIDEECILYTFSKVAGYDTAVYGLNKKKLPYVFRHPKFNNVIIFTSRISSPETSRFTPKNFFIKLYKEIFDLNILFNSCVSPKYEKNVKVSSDDIKKTITLSTDWFKKYMLVDDYNGLKVYEGFTSKINNDGSQVLAKAIRNDCTGEAALVFALDSLYKKNSDSAKTSEKLIKYVFSDINQIKDLNCGNYGFVKWYGNGKNIYYSDDNARMLLGIIPSVGIIKNNKYYKDISSCVISFLRTIPDNHIHAPRIDYTDEMIVEDVSYKGIKERVRTFYSPHYVSYIWSVFLIMYGITGDKELLEVSKSGIDLMMSKYPDNWRWTNGIMAEVSRIMLPLALLYKYDKSKENYEYIEKIYNALLEQIDENGCLLEKMEYLENGKYPPSKCNDDYGKYEAPIIHDNSNKACDLLYSQNFAYLGLHEAYCATSNVKYKKLFDTMTDFLIKIQTKSEKHKELNGIWQRSFDPEKWEYFGSGADSGWSAFCVESGWTNSWINSVLTMKELNKSITDFNIDTEHFKNVYNDIKVEMMK